MNLLNNKLYVNMKENKMFKTIQRFRLIHIYKKKIKYS